MKFVRNIQGAISLVVAGVIGLIALGIGLLSLLARQWLVAVIFLGIAGVVAYILLYRREDAIATRYEGERDDMEMGQRRR